MKHRLSFVLTLISLLPTLVLAQGLTGNWYDWFNVPAAWATPPNIIYFVFIPFLGTFTIIFGILTATRARIFENKRVNIIISFVFTISLFYFNILPPIILYLFTFGGFFGVVAFFVLFFMLTFLFGARRVGIEYKTTKEIFREIPKEDIRKTTRLIDRQFKQSEKIRKEIRKVDVKLINEERAITTLLRQIGMVRSITNPNTLERRWGARTQEGAWRKIRSRLNIHNNRRMRYLKRKRQLIEQLDKLTEVQAKLGSI